MSGDDQHGFFIQLYEDIEGVPKFIVEFESEVLGADVPRMGDCIIAPVSYTHLTLPTIYSV